MASRPIYTTKVELDDAVRAATAAMDYGKNGIDGKLEHEFDGTRTFVGWPRPQLPADFGIFMIVGPSGSGKTLLLNQFGKESQPVWERSRAIVSHFDDSHEALEKFAAVGLNSVPAWASPFHILSNGEKFRADLARKLQSGAVIDEFTSVVDRTVAKSVSVALRRYVDNHGLKNLVLATCHYDVLEWVQPDWWFDAATGELHPRGSLQRPTIEIKIYASKRTIWPLFRNFHYYNTGDLPSSCRSYLATVKLGDADEEVVGFVASRPLPSGTIRNAYIACRTVVLPDFQGLGIGPRLSDAVAEIHVSEGKRYFSKTTSSRLGGWRDRPDSGWIPTSKYDPRKGPQSRFTRRSRKSGNVNTFGGTRRTGYYSHEYVGHN